MSVNFSGFALGAVRKWVFVAVGGLAMSSAVYAAPVTGQVKADIEAVLTRLADSGCDFQRNGTWHDSRKAREHLLKKLNYIEGRGDVKSAEQFIEMAATKNSMSGKAYQVRCGQQAPRPSQQWLLERLVEVRAQPAASR